MRKTILFSSSEGGSQSRIRSTSAVTPCRAVRSDPLSWRFAERSSNHSPSWRKRAREIWENNPNFANSDFKGYHRSNASRCLYGKVKIGPSFMNACVLVRKRKECECPEGPLRIICLAPLQLVNTCFVLSFGRTAPIGRVVTDTVSCYRHTRGTDFPIL